MEDLMNINPNNSFLITFIIIFFSFAFSVAEKNAATELIPGDPAPAFQANDDNGELWKSSDFLNKKYIVVYFYPAAMTGGCTVQACSYRDHKSGLDELDVELVGISGDPVKNLKLFKMANNLNFTLLSDVSGEIAKKFGVPLDKGGSIERKVDGKDITMQRALTSARWTFIIDKGGKIAYKNTQVKAANDSQDVLNFIKRLK
jgi:peroxiredoxin Q/BCP